MIIDNSRFARIALPVILAFIILIGLVDWQGNQSASPRILYIAPDTQERGQLFAVPLAGGEARQLTYAKFGVLEYAPSPDGREIAYTALREEGGANLWAVNSNGGNNRELFNCEEAACAGPVWSQNGRRLIFTQGVSPQTLRLWQLDIVTGATKPLLPGEQNFGYAARFSPDGVWINYISPVAQGIQLYNLEDGSGFLVPGQITAPGEWSPRGDAILVSDALIAAERFAGQILRVDVETGDVSNLTNGVQADDASPVWSTDGSQIAFGRKAPQVAMGRQLWLMNFDATQVRPLTNEAHIHHIPLAWSPDDRYLLYQRQAFLEADAEPAIWLFDLETEQTWELASPGGQGSWLFQIKQ